MKMHDIKPEGPVSGRKKKERKREKTKGRNDQNSERKLLELKHVNVQPERSHSVKEKSLHSER